MGALIPSVVKANITLNFKQGNFSMKGQDILDQIMPGLLPRIISWFSFLGIKEER